MGSVLFEKLRETRSHVMKHTTVNLWKVWKAVYVGIMLNTYYVFFFYNTIFFHRYHVINQVSEDSYKYVNALLPSAKRLLHSMLATVGKIKLIDASIQGSGTKTEDIGNTNMQEEGMYWNRVTVDGRATLNSLLIEFVV